MPNPFSVLSNLFALLAAYVRHRTATDLDRRIDISRTQLRGMAAEIDSLRDDGSPAATQRADWLRVEYLNEAAHLKYLRSRRSAAESRDLGADL